MTTKRISVRTHDSPYSLRARRYRARDDVLNAIPSGKVLCMGTVWAGDLRPYVDAALSAVDGALLAATGFTPGHVLEADPTPASLDLGETWLGDAIHRVRKAAQDSQRKGADTDITGLLADLDRLRDTMGVEPMNFGAVKDRLSRAWDSFNAVNNTRRPAAGPTSDATAVLRASTADNRTRGDAINKANAALWDKQRTTATVARMASDSAGMANPGARDALAEVNRSTTPRERGEAMRRLHDAFWSRKNPTR